MFKSHHSMKSWVFSTLLLWSPLMASASFSLCVPAGTRLQEVLLYAWWFCNELSYTNEGFIYFFLIQRQQQGVMLSSLLLLPIRSGVCRTWTRLWTTVVWVRFFFFHFEWSIHLSSSWPHRSGSEMSLRCVCFISRHHDTMCVWPDEECIYPRGV